MVQEHLSRVAAPDELEFIVIGGSARRREQVGDYSVNVFSNTKDVALYKSYLRACDLMMFPSEMDSTAMVVQEALAQGVPSIVFDVGGLPEMVEHKKNGYLARPYYSEDLADALAWWRSLDNNNRQGVRMYAAARAKDMHNANRCVQRYLSVYEAAINRYRSGETFQTGALVPASPPTPDAPVRRHRAFIVDPSVVNTKDSSHNTEHALAFAASLEASYVPTTLIVNREADFSHPIGATMRLLDWTIYDKVRALPESPAAYASFSNPSDKSTVESLAICDALVGLLENQNLNADDLVLFPTTDRFCIEGLLIYLFGYGGNATPSFHLNLMFEHANFLYGGYPLSDLMSALAKSGYVGQRVFLYSETERMAQDLSNRFDLPVQRHPPPSVFSPEQLQRISLPIKERARESYAKCSAALHSGTRAMRSASKKRSVAVVGRGRRDKGWDKLPKIIETFNNRFGARNANFVIQRPRDMDGLKAQQEIVESFPNVDLRDAIIPAADLEAIIQHADVVLLPYDPGVYGNRGSAFAWKAVANAIPIVVSRDTALVEALLPTSEGNSDDGLDDVTRYRNGAVAQTPDEFAESIRDVLDNQRSFREGARAMRDLYYVESVQDTELKNNMRQENFFNPSRTLILVDPYDTESDGNQSGDPDVFSARIFVDSTDEECSRQRALPVDGNGISFQLCLPRGEALKTDHLPAPVASALANNMIDTIRVPNHLAINQGILRDLPESWLRNVCLY